MSRRHGFKQSEEHKAKISAAMLGVPKSSEARANMSAAKKGKPAKNKGVKMTPEQKINSGRKAGSVPWNKGLKTGHAPWLGKKRGPASDETKKKMSLARTGKPQSDAHAAAVLAAWRGSRPVYAGIKMRSSYEVRLAKAFDARNIRWIYEQKRFNLETCSYLPDFYLPDEDVYWEAKGYFSEESQNKCALFRKLHPETPLIVANRSVIEMMESVVHQN